MQAGSSAGPFPDGEGGHPLPAPRGTGRSGDPSNCGLRHCFPVQRDLAASARQARLGLLSPLLSNTAGPAAAGGGRGKPHTAKFSFDCALSEQPLETSQLLPSLPAAGSRCGEVMEQNWGMLQRSVGISGHVYSCTCFDLYQTGGSCDSSGSAVVCGYLWKWGGTS